MKDIYWFLKTISSIWFLIAAYFEIKHNEEKMSLYAIDGLVCLHIGFLLAQICGDVFAMCMFAVSIVMILLYHASAYYKLY
jgi:hypothetical protein